MQIFILIFSLLFLIQNISSHNVNCNDEYITLPSSEYQCAGLNINKENDTHCCYWNGIKFDDTPERYCGSIDEKQYNNIHEYITKKIVEKKYKKLDIRCAEIEQVYCSNILLDLERGFDCTKLSIADPKDNHCCKWSYEDTSNDDKVEEYCASLSQYQYLTINDYINYKEDNGFYKNLCIDCFVQLIKYNIFMSLILFISIFI